MHNSLFIRPLLKKTNSDPLYTSRRDSHRLVDRDPAATPVAGEMLLASAWSIRCDVGDGVGQLIEADLADFLRRMQVETCRDADQTISLSLTEGLAERDCRFTIMAGDVRIEAGGVPGLWAGVAWLEWEMRTRRGPILPKGAFGRTASWPIQISQGPFGGNYSVPDFSPEYLGPDSFPLYAHYGVNGMMIYGDILCYAESAILPELNHPEAKRHLSMLIDAAKTAVRYGVRFHWCIIGPKLRADHPVFVNHPETRGATFKAPDGTDLYFLCSSSRLVLDFYEELFRQVFTAVPELAGVIAITYAESFYHCRMWTHKGSCPSCQERDPEDVVAGQLDAVLRGIRAAGSDAYLASWVYSWDRGARKPYFEKMPEETWMYHQVEKDQIIQKDGYRKKIWDYSVDYIGPSDDIRELAAYSRESGRPLMVKTETGIGLEVFQFPYVPAMMRLADKWQVVRDQGPIGVQQSWLFYGMFGSRAEELAFWAAYRPEQPRDEFLRAMARRDFGPGAVDGVMRAWEATSRAMGHLPAVTYNYYYVGPSFLGPAHPLLPTRDTPVPDVFRANLFYLLELEETFSLASIDTSLTTLAVPELLSGQWSMIPDPGETIASCLIREYAVASADMAEACDHLRRALAATTHEADRRNLDEESVLCELIWRTFVTCWNVARFYDLRDRHAASPDPALHQAMLAVARGERENALAAQPLYRKAPWLDLCARIDGHYSSCIDMIDEKVRMLDRFLAEA